MFGGTCSLVPLCMCFDDSLHQCGRETWMSAGLTDRKMVECRRGRMDGNEKDEY